MSVFDAQKILDGGAMPVHVTNMSEMQVVSTEEKEPEHFVIRTIVLGPFSGVEPGVVQNWYANAVQLDPLRKSVSVYNPDGVMIVCHSEAQASDAANIETGTPFPEGGYFPQNSSVSLDGTGALWVVNPTAGTVRITVVQNRRGI